MPSPTPRPTPPRGQYFCTKAAPGLFQQPSALSCLLPTCRGAPLGLTTMAVTLPPRSRLVPALVSLDPGAWLPLWPWPSSVSGYPQPALFCVLPPNADQDPWKPLPSRAAPLLSETPPSPHKLPTVWRSADTDPSWLFPFFPLEM